MATSQPGVILLHSRSARYLVQCGESLHSLGESTASADSSRSMSGPLNNRTTRCPFRRLRTGETGRSTRVADSARRCTALQASFRSRARNSHRPAFRISPTGSLVQATNRRQPSLTLILIVHPTRSGAILSSSFILLVSVRPVVHKVHGLRLRDGIQSPRVLQSCRLVHANGVSQRGPHISHFRPLYLPRSSSHRPPRVSIDSRISRDQFTAWVMFYFIQRSGHGTVTRSAPCVYASHEDTESLYSGQTLRFGSPCTCTHNLRSRRRTSQTLFWIELTQHTGAMPVHMRMEETSYAPEIQCESKVSEQGFLSFPSWATPFVGGTNSLYSSHPTNPPIHSSRDLSLS